ncbi:MAG: tryptophan synthase subunit alpha [Candidatus Latescibacterota bacterium]
MDLTRHIRRRLAERRILLMTHLIAGYPSLEANWRMLEAMAAADVDLVEVQVPFSEPVADGPVFARANQVALEGGTTLAASLDLLGRAAGRFGFPLLVMGYYNTAFRLGHGQFCARLRDCGASGFILPDLPVEEYGDLFPLSLAAGLCPILLMAPTNTAERLRRIGQQARVFAYAVARRGVTGRRTVVGEDVDAFLGRCRQATDLPLGVGFGLVKGEDLRALQGKAEVGIVGSALLAAWEEGEPAYRSLLADLARGRL